MEVAEKKENHTLRSATAIMLFLIGYAHFFISTSYGYEYSQTFGDIIEIIIGFGRFCIPIFFMISGYFLFSSDGHTERRIGKKILHILYLIILLKVSYLILVGIAYAGGAVSFDYFINSFVTAEMTSTVHVWFLYVLILMYIFFWALQKFKIDFSRIYWTAWIPIVVIMFVGNILPLIFSPGDPLYVDVSSSDMLYPFLGYSFFIFGYYLHQNKERFDKDFSNLTLWIFIIIGTIMAIVECRYNMQRSIYFGTLLQVVGIFLITFRFAEDQLRCRPLESIGKNLMPFFYVYMMAPVFVCSTYLHGNISTFDYNIICPIVCVFVTLMISYVAYKLLQFATNKSKRKRAVAS